MVCLLTALIEYFTVPVYCTLPDLVGMSNITDHNYTVATSGTQHYNRHNIVSYWQCQTTCNYILKVGIL